MFTELLVVAASLTQVAPLGTPPPPVTRFQIGERAEYAVSYLFARGHGTVEVLGIDSVRGRDAYHFRVTLEGGGLGYRLRDSSQSWVDTATFNSLRFYQDAEEKGKPRVRRWEIFPEERVYRDSLNTSHPSVADPLDDVSFFFFVRRLPLEIGKTMEFSNYFRPESNPVRVHVVKRERIEVPAGTFNAIVIRPVIKTKGIFSERGRAQVWISDDPARIILQITTRMPIGTITMKLRSYRASVHDTAVSQRRN